MREMFRVPYVWAKHHFAKLNNLVALAIGGALNWHLPVEVLGTKMEMIALFGKALKLPNQEITSRRI